ncbi:MAG: FtsX-like permease family protein [Streptosporangiaceae bacterium]
MTSLAIAGCTLATNIAAGLADRKRPFSMLRLTGVRIATLRRMVVLESAVPLIAVAIVAIGAAWVPPRCSRPRRCSTRWSRPAPGTT